uniref:D-alanyl-D-alanine carboxypeptidase/D-alanyl-D-alanine-endopeptidase n=1 Tax=Rhizochromulina marina TaxID=1034831 RepID=A0A7S2W8Y0_9STRA
MARLNRLWVFFLLASASARVSVNDTLAAQIHGIIGRPEFTGCNWAIHAAKRLDHGDKRSMPVFDLRGDHFMVPASNTKLLSTFSAWTTLGASFQFSTPLVLTWAADMSAAMVTLCGAGDPSLTSTQLRQAVAEILEAAPALAEASTVTVQVDATRSSPGEEFPSSWEWGDLNYYYGAEPTAVILDANDVYVTVTPGESVGQVATVSMSPSSLGADACVADVQNSVITVSDSDYAGLGALHAYRRGDVVLDVSGSIAVGSAPVTLTVACQDPLSRAAEAIVAVLGENGVNASSRTPSAITYSCAECSMTNSTLASIVSPTLDVLLNHTLLVSDNTYAEAIFRRLGEDGSYELARGALDSTLDSLGLDTSRYSVLDGSGLSRHDLVTPRFFVDLLLHADEEYVHFLPLAGRTGSLASRFIGTPAEGELYAKTGTMSNVNALSGVVGDVVFSIISNQCPQPSSVVRQGIDDIAVLFVDV